MIVTDNLFNFKHNNLNSCKSSVSVDKTGIEYESWLHGQDFFDKILIIHVNTHIGDLILSSPVIRRLRELHPKSEINFALREAHVELYKYNSDIDNIIVLDNMFHLPIKSNLFSRYNFDFVVSLSIASGLDKKFLSKINYKYFHNNKPDLYSSLQEEFYGAPHIALAYSIKAGVIIDFNNCYLYYGNDDLEWANQFNYDKKFTVVIAPSSMENNKKISGEFCDKIIDYLHSKDIRVVVFRPSNNMNGKYELVENNTVLQMAAYIDKYADLVITADSMAAHVASCYKKNQIVINNHIWKAHPLNEKAVTIYGENFDVVKNKIDFVLDGNNFEREAIGEIKKNRFGNANNWFNMKNNCNKTTNNIFFNFNNSKISVKKDNTLNGQMGSLNILFNNNDKIHNHTKKETCQCAKRKK